MPTLIVTEKPSVAERIANSIGSPKRLSAHGVTHYQVGDTFVAPLVGHMYGITEKDSKGWTYPVFDVEWIPNYAISKESAFTKKYLDSIKEIARKCDKFINSCDYDIEGEVIGFNAIKFACGADPFGPKVRRMKYSTLTTESIQKAYSSLEPTHKGMVEAGLTRHVLDWFWGINLSRALSLSCRRAGRYMTLSIGRVQGPTLKFLAALEKEIAAFKPEPYWVIELLCVKDAKKFSAVHEKEKFFDKNEAEAVRAKCGKTATVVSAEKKKVNVRPPEPFDLTTLQTEAHRWFKIDPSKTLEIAQDLYTSALISYPRTSSQQLPPDIDYRKIMRSLSGIKEYEALMKELSSKKGLKPANGKKTDPAHPAIHPTGEIPGSLSGDHKKIYDLIVKCFMATFADAAVRENATVKLDNNGETFVAKGALTVKEGWHRFYAPYVKLEEVELPALSVGDVVSIERINFDGKMTQPPKRYTPASIIRKMEKENIGTKATRSQIVDILFKRGYIKGKSLEVTQLGIDVVDTLNKYCPQVVSISLTRKFEEEMEKIHEGSLESDAVVTEGKQALTKILNEFKKNEMEIGRGLCGSALSQMRAKNRIGQCIKCEGSLVLRSGRDGSQFLGCDTYPKCTFTMSLPKGKISLAADCKQCGWRTLKLAGARPWFFCVNPKCPTKKRYSQGQNLSGS